MTQIAVIRIQTILRLSNTMKKKILNHIKSDETIVKELESQSDRVDSAVIVSCNSSQELSTELNDSTINRFVTKSVSFSEDIVIHSIEDWNSRLERHRIRKKRKTMWFLPKVSKEEEWWLKFKHSFKRILRSCHDKSNMAVDDSDSVSILNS